jgi:flagellar hook assembly protein FlgD
MPDTEIQAELQVYDLTGRLLRTLQQSFFSEGFTSGAFDWDGRDANGNRMDAGIYPYRMILRTEKGQIAWQTSRMVIGFR